MRLYCVTAELLQGTFTNTTCSSNYTVFQPMALSAVSLSDYVPNTATNAGGRFFNLAFDVLTASRATMVAIQKTFTNLTFAFNQQYSFVAKVLVFVLEGTLNVSKSPPPWSVLKTSKSGSSTSDCPTWGMVLFNLIQAIDGHLNGQPKKQHETTIPLKSWLICSALHHPSLGLPYVQAVATMFTIKPSFLHFTFLWKSPEQSIYINVACPGC